MRANIHHFKRATLAFTAIAAALALPGMSQQQAALALVPEYKSRGKGRGSVSRNWLRPYTNSRPPHQGAQECARRRRQIARGTLNRDNGLVFGRVMRPRSVVTGLARMGA